ncbi:MAG: lamin tail domain-containing protein [Planctomycetes bacterium]|nr:lamin tail domain-containing protein [Planctomycetota bacterium]
MLTTSFLLAALCPQGQGSSTAPVVINEFSYDDTSSNDSVFVELYNRTTGPVDISGWILRGHDGTSTGNGLITIAASTVLFPGDYYVVGQAAKVPNVDQDEPTINTLLETGPDGLTLELPSGFVMDGVTWEMAKWTNAVPAWLEGDGLQGDIFNNDNLPQSAARKIDGYDSDDNGCDFRVMPWSPGAANQSVFTAGPVYGNDFDDAPGTAVGAEFSWSFVPGTTEDPAVLGIPASPQGGNCSVWYDPTGGGDVNYYNSGSLEDWVLECYVYLRGPEATFDSNDIETWVLGARGTADSFGHPIDVTGGLYAYTGLTYASGDTGIGWMQVITQTTSDLYLVDFNNGGSDFTVLAGPLAVTADGWSRLRLSAIGGDVVGNVGGTYGCDDGTRVTASNVSVCSGGVYVQYRENVTGAHRPLTLDALAISSNVAAAWTLVGAGSATTTGVPTITGNGVPTVGNASYSIEGSNLVPNQFSFTLMNIGPATLPGTQIAGAQAGALLYVSNVGAAVVLNLTGAAGTSSTPLPIPCVTLLTGLPIGAQIIDYDPALSDPLPLGTSAGLTSIVGN